MRNGNHLNQNTSNNVVMRMMTWYFVIKKKKKNVLQNRTSEIASCSKLKHHAFTWKCHAQLHFRWEFQWKNTWTWYLVCKMMANFHEIEDTKNKTIGKCYQDKVYNIFLKYTYQTSKYHNSKFIIQRSCTHCINKSQKLQRHFCSNWACWNLNFKLIYSNQSKFVILKIVRCGFWINIHLGHINWLGWCHKTFEIHGSRFILTTNSNNKIITIQMMIIIMNVDNFDNQRTEIHKHRSQFLKNYYIHKQSTIKKATTRFR